MKKLVGTDIGNYAFSPSTKQIILIGVPAIALKQVLIITNVTDNITIFQFNDNTLGGSETNNVITLNYDTTLMATTDELQIYLDLPDTSPVDDAAQAEAYTHILLERILLALQPLANQDISNRQRIVVDAITGNLTLATVTTVGSLTGGTITTITNPVPVGNIATFAGLSPLYNYIDSARMSYAKGIRANLTFTN